jgi:cytidylate kinase
VYNAGVKKSIITIAGLLGSGKSTTAKAVAKELGYQHFSTGDLVRAIGLRHGLNIGDTNIMAEHKKEIDQEVDDENRRMNEEGKELVIDSRLAFYFIPDSFKVFLRLAPEIAADRILNQIHTEGRIGQTASSREEVLADIERRYLSEQKRYRSLYNVDIYDMSKYDLIVDTDKNDLEAVKNMVISAYKAWQEN